MELTRLTTWLVAHGDQTLLVVSADLPSAVRKAAACIGRARLGEASIRPLCDAWMRVPVG